MTTGMIVLGIIMFILLGLLTIGCITDCRANDEGDPDRYKEERDRHMETFGHTHFIHPWNDN